MIAGGIYSWQRDPLKNAEFCFHSKRALFPSILLFAVETQSLDYLRAACGRRCITAIVASVHQTIASEFHKSTPFGPRGVAQIANLLSITVTQPFWAGSPSSAMHKTYALSRSIPAFGALAEPAGVRLGWVSRYPHRRQVSSNAVSLARAPPASVRPRGLTSPMQSE